jgi:RIO kinase 1
LILKDDKELFVIDVSQSVEHDHPRSLDFLRHDIKNVQEFFGKNILVGDYKEIFEFITSPTINDSNYETILEDILRKAKKLEPFNVAEEVFRQTHIPRKMQEIVDYERDYEKMKKGEKELVYSKILGMKPDMSGPAEGPAPSSSDPNSGEDSNLRNLVNGVSGRSYDGASESGSSSESGNDDDSEDEDGTLKKDQTVRPKNESAEEKRQRKKQVKEEKAEKRKSKVKKHVKKRKEKLAHANSKR